MAAGDAMIRRTTDRLKGWAKALRRDLHALYLAGRDPRVPWLPKLVAMLIAAYALSPIDLIPDFIPVLGYLDDLILVPAGIALAIHLIPPELMAQHRQRAAALQERFASRTGLYIVLVLWSAAALLIGWAVVNHSDIWR